MIRETGARRILYWADPTMLNLGGAIEWAAKLLGHVPLPRPQDCVRNDIPYADRRVVAKALEIHSTMSPTGGNVLMGYFGYADCRICGKQLGTRDLFRYGFVWPEGAEHYILDHNVWNADCDAFLVAVRSSR